MNLIFHSQKAPFLEMRPSFPSGDIKIEAGLSFKSIVFSYDPQN